MHLIQYKKADGTAKTDPTGPRKIGNRTVDVHENFILQKDDGQGHAAFLVNAIHEGFKYPNSRTSTATQAESSHLPKKTAPSKKVHHSLMSLVPAQLEQRVAVCLDGNQKVLVALVNVNKHNHPFLFVTASDAFSAERYVPRKYVVQ